MEGISSRAGVNSYSSSEEGERDRALSSVTISRTPTPLPFDFDDEVQQLVEFHNTPQISKKLTNCEVVVFSALASGVSVLFWYYLNYYFNPNSKIFMHFTLKM
ncbi:MAG: hypothetical protein FJZ59_05510 [Chlamydiae bacterium]|nr:hypothetical protein [Chlamydiota bacterium]